MSEGQKQGVGLFAILAVVAAIVLIVGIVYNGYRLHSYTTPPPDQADPALSRFSQSSRTFSAYRVLKFACPFFDLLGTFPRLSHS